MKNQLILLVTEEVGDVVRLKRELSLLDHSVLIMTKLPEKIDGLPGNGSNPGIVVWAFGETREHLFQQIRVLTSRFGLHPIVISNDIPEGDRFQLFRLGISALLSELLSHRELALRIHSLLEIEKKTIMETGVSREWQLGQDSLRIDEDRHKAFYNGNYVKLTETEWRVLRYLAVRAGAICSRDAIVDRCMGYEDSTAYRRSLDTHIKNIRKKIGSHRWIETIRGYGYQFTGITAGKEAMVRQ